MQVVVLVCIFCLLKFIELLLLLCRFGCFFPNWVYWVLLGFIGFMFKRSFFFCFPKIRAGELSAAELESLMTIVANPRQFKIPDWFLNRKKDYKDGRYSQVVSNALDMKLRDDLERLKKIR